MSIVDPDIFVVERRNGLLRDASGSNRGEGRDRHRYALAESGRGGHAFRCAELWICQNARVAVGLQQTIKERRHVGQEHARLIEIHEIFKREIFAIDVHHTVDAGRSWRGELESMLEEAGAVDLEQFDVDHNLGPRFIDGRNQAACRGDAFGRVFDGQRIGRGDRRQSAVVDHDAEQVERLLDVGIAQIERPNDLVLVLRALGRSIRDDGDRSLRGDPVKLRVAVESDSSASPMLAFRRSIVTS